MAFELSEELDTGIVAEYWRIERFEIGTEPGIEYPVAVVTFGLYVTQESRVAGKLPVRRKMARINFVDSQEVADERNAMVAPSNSETVWYVDRATFDFNGNIREQLYTILKQSQDWKTAIDVM